MFRSLNSINLVGLRDSLPIIQFAAKSPFIDVFSWSMQIDSLNSPSPTAAADSMATRSVLGVAEEGRRAKGKPPPGNGGIDRIELIHTLQSVLLTHCHKSTTHSGTGRQSSSFGSRYKVWIRNRIRIFNIHGQESHKQVNCAVAAITFDWLTFSRGSQVASAMNVQLG